MTAHDPAKTFQRLVKKLRAKAEPEVTPPARDDPMQAGLALLDQLLYDFVLWEASSAQARLALKRLRDTFVDPNELRVAMPHEVAEVLGERYPLGIERSIRLRATLQDIYRREHAVTLAPVAVAAKREARQYLESLDGMPPFVVARLVVLGLGGHAMPADCRLIDLLLEHKALPVEHMAARDACAWLERQVRANDAPAVTTALQDWSDEKGSSPKFDRETGIGVPPVPVPTPANAGASALRRARVAAVKRKSERNPTKPRGK